MPASTSAVLTGLSVATGIAREATDGVPIVKQVLGVASRIVELAEQVDKNREDLHALADRAKKMDATITDIIGDRELDGRMLRCLEDMNRVLRAIEKLFDKQIRRGRVQKTLRYIFTVRKEVDRLRGEFDDRLRELEVAASLDTNISAKRDARFNGEFRNIRHCEIDLLRRITPRNQPGQNYIINCHLATCDGYNQVVVVREIVESGQNEDARWRIEDHDNILEYLSLVQNRHPNIAYLYGRNSGPKDNRFVVLKAGDVRLLNDVLSGQGPAEISLMGRIVAKLMDVTCHLQKYGAAYTCHRGGEPNLYLDKNYEPKIGIDDDLYTMRNGPASHACTIKLTLGMVDFYCAPESFPENRLPSAHLQCTTWIKELFGTLIDPGYHTNCRETVFRRVDIPNLVPLSQESRIYLRQSDLSFEYALCYWSIILLDLAIGGKIRGGSFLHTRVHGQGPSAEYDSIDVYCSEDTVEAVYHSMTTFEIPRSAGDEVWQRLGIPPTGAGPASCFLECFEGSSATSMECTGWSAGYDCSYPWERGVAARYRQ